MIKLSTKGRYAARIMVYLASQDAGAMPTQKHRIAKAENMSPDYVEQILLKLSAAGLVKSHRGIKGGFSLARNAKSISIADILHATEGAVSMAPCHEEKCPRGLSCVTKSVWDKAAKALDAVFSGTNIAELAEQARKKRDADLLSFEI